MKRIKPLIAALLVVILLIGTIPAAHASGSIKNVRITEDGTMTWDHYQGAVEYWLRFGKIGRRVFPPDLSVNLNELGKKYGYKEGSYPIMLVALSDAAVEISEEWTGTFTLTEDYTKEKLASPSNLRWNGYVAMWDPVPHAEMYYVKVENKENLTSQTGFTYTNSMNVYDLLSYGNNTYFFTVYAQADGYWNSDKAKSPETRLQWPVLEPITDVSVTVTTPEAGERPSYTAAVPTGANYQIRKTSDAYTVNGVSWYCKDTATWLDGSNPGRFEAGKTYMAQVSLEVKNASKYAFDETDRINAKMNGKTASCAYLDGDNDRLAVWYYFTLPEGEAVTSVNLTVPAPAAGATPSYQATVPAGAKYRIEDFDMAPYWLNGVYWTVEGEGDVNCIEPGIFEEGKSYTVQISVVLTDSARYDFADNTILYLTVNGCEASYRYYPGEENIVASYTFSLGGAVLLGDADDDGKVTILDATAIQRVLVALPVGSFAEPAADADRDTKITILDATAIQRYLAALPTNPLIGTLVDPLSVK